MSTHSSRTQGLLLPETYHLIGVANYNEWAFTMMNILKRGGLFKYCTTPPQAPLLEADERIRILVMRALNSNAKHLALCVIKRFHDAYIYWTHLKSRFEADNNPRKVHLIDNLSVVRN